MPLSFSCVTGGAREGQFVSKNQVFLVLLSCHKTENFPWLFFIANNQLFPFDAISVCVTVLVLQIVFFFFILHFCYLALRKLMGPISQKKAKHHILRYN